MGVKKKSRKKKQAVSFWEYLRLLDKDIIYRENFYLVISGIEHLPKKGKSLPLKKVPQSFNDIQDSEFYESFLNPSSHGLHVSIKPEDGILDFLKSRKGVLFVNLK